MNINRQYITKINFTDKNSTARIKYIVIHYFGGLSTAKSLAAYWAREYIGASAHYAVGHAGEVYQIVEDDDVAWHCGTSGKYKHALCRNSNSIGIEMAVKKKSAGTLNATDKDWYFTPETVATTIELTKMLMKKYNVPAENVLRHYDVTGKICPNPYYYNLSESTWAAFKAAISTPAAAGETGEEKPAIGSAQGVDVPEVKKAAGMLKIIYTGADGVNYRTTPDYNAPIAGRAYTGGIFTVVGETGDFYKLKSGWYITKRSDLVQFTPKEMKRYAKIIYKGEDGVNYRAIPDYTAKKTGVAHYGDLFTVVGETGDFYKLKAGWYLTKRADLVELIEVA